ncbi:MAG TPA: IS200/IS605 family transposase [Pyrinomonadaceae bacterium]|nr:IS200/IS605 family transposase [Pyrinomonadaceae bacterium]
MPHTHTNLLTHVVFGTKDRMPLIPSELKHQLHAYMGGIVRELGGKAYIVNGTTDHVHLLISLPPALALSDVVRVLKTNSSRWMRSEKKAGKFGWQPGYGAFSVSQSNVKAVAAYIDKQEEHHRKVSFRDEFVAFLKKNEIEFDENFLWG